MKSFQKTSQRDVGRSLVGSSGGNQFAGFTLVELLVVIAIIGILISMLLPAVSQVREAARRAKCSNNVKQMAMGCLSHLEVQGYFPLNGRNYDNAAKPRRGFGSDQDGGWHYNILPFIEQNALRDLGADAATDAAAATILNNQVVTAIVPLFVCPSRGSGGFKKGTRIWGRSDYAGNAGNRPGGWSGNTVISWLGSGQTGVMIGQTILSTSDIKDGISNTYLLGERYINPDAYHDGWHRDNDNGWTAANDPDVHRCTDYNDTSAANIEQSKQYAPTRDTPGLDPGRYMFGSPHSGFNMAFCDGSVRLINFEIDRIQHRNLGDRRDGAIISSDVF